MARHVKFLAFGALVLALPATAHTFGFPADVPQTCVAIGKTTWRVATGGASADLTVRIDPSAAIPHIRIRLTDTPDDADFVFVDDGAPSGCASARRVNISTTAATPDLTIGFASGAQAADYRVYVRSRTLGPEAVAALFAAAQMPARKLVARAQ